MAQRPGWTDVWLGERYSASFALIGDRILLTAPVGNAGTRGIPRFWAARERVLREAGIWDRRHFEVKDYGGVDHDHPRMGRVQFTMGMRAEEKRGKLRGFWGYNGIPAFVQILNVAKALIGHKGSPAEFVPDYEAAVTRAMQAQRDSGIDLPGREPERLCREGWILDMDSFRCRFEILGADILLSTMKGACHERHVDRVFEIMGSVLGEMVQPPLRAFYRVNDASDLEHVSWNARRRTINRIRALPSEHRSRHFVMVGAGRPLRAVVRAASTVVSGNLSSSATMEEALEVIHATRLDHASPALRPRGLVGKAVALLRGDMALSSPPRPLGADHRRSMDRLLHHLGRINWDMESLEPGECGEDDPMRELYDAMSVVKYDFDIMKREREAMQERVIQAAKVASLGTLAAGFAHEMRNPLTAVLSYAQLIAMQTGDDDTRLQAQRIEAAARRMKTVTDNLNLAARDPGPAGREPVCINALIDDALSLLLHQLEGCHITVETSLQPDLPAVRGDAGHLQTLVQNLVLNARDAFDLERHGKKRLIRVCTTTYHEGGGDWVVLSVEDNGRGMATAVRERIFDPFFTTKEVGKGTGLGLFLSHCIVDDHQGEFRVESEEDCGARFEVRLPVADPGISD